MHLECFDPAPLEMLQSLAMRVLAVSDKVEPVLYSSVVNERIGPVDLILSCGDLPFYYIEYGMAQIGALQVWRNALGSQQDALADYRSSLSLGGTRSLPELFAAAGAEFRFDTSMVSALVELVEETIDRLESERDN